MIRKLEIKLIVDFNPVEEVKDNEKEKWKKKSIEYMLGIPKSKKRGSRKKQKCDRFRSTVAAAALAISFEGIDRIYLNKANCMVRLTRSSALIIWKTMRELFAELWLWKLKMMKGQKFRLFSFLFDLRCLFWVFLPWLQE